MEQLNTGVKIGVKLIAAVVAFFLPPLAILIVRGSLNSLILNLILTFFFWIPGIIHALYCVFRDDPSNPFNLKEEEKKE